MPAITLSTVDLALLRRCFARMNPESGRWAEPDDGEEAAIAFEAATLAGSLLAAAQPDQPIAFPQKAWEAFAACCEVGAELLDGSRAEDLTDAEYERVLRLLCAPTRADVGEHSEPGRATRPQDAHAQVRHKPRLGRDAETGSPAVEFGQTARQPAYPGAR